MNWLVADSYLVFMESPFWNTFSLVDQSSSTQAIKVWHHLTKKILKVQGNGKGVKVYCSGILVDCHN